MCNCKSMVRDATQETLYVGVGLSKHHPECEDYKVKTYYRVEHDGAVCVMENIDDIEEEFMDAAYSISEIQLTPDQFENLKEFEGW